MAEDGSKNSAFLSPEAAACMESLRFKDCKLILRDIQTPCHRSQLAKVSDVLG